MPPSGGAFMSLIPGDTEAGLTHCRRSDWTLVTLGLIVVKVNLKVEPRVIHIASSWFDLDPSMTNSWLKFQLLRNYG